MLSEAVDRVAIRACDCHEHICVHDICVLCCQSRDVVVFGIISFTIAASHKRSATLSEQQLICCHQHMGSTVNDDDVLTDSQV